MENKKYRTFEIVDGEIKLIKLDSNFQKFCIGTANFSGDAYKERIELLKRFQVIGYFFSCDYSKKINVLIFNDKNIGGTGKSLFVNGISNLLHFYTIRNRSRCFKGRDKFSAKDIESLVLDRIYEREPSFVHLDDMVRYFDYIPFINEINSISTDLGYLPVVITTNNNPEDIPNFYDSGINFIKCEFGPCFAGTDVSEEICELFGKHYSTIDYIQDIVFCLDCLDFYNDLNADNVTI